MNFFKDSFRVVCSYGLPSSLGKFSEPLIWSQRLRAVVYFSCRYTHFVTGELFWSSSFWLPLLSSNGMEPLPLWVSCRRATVALILLDFMPYVSLYLWEEKGATLTRNLASAVHRWDSGRMRNVYPPSRNKMPKVMPLVLWWYHCALMLHGELTCHHCWHAHFWTLNMALSAAAVNKIDSKMYLCCYCDSLY